MYVQKIEINNKVTCLTIQEEFGGKTSRHSNMSNSPSRFPSSLSLVKHGDQQAKHSTQ